jgi:plastocyanin
MRMRTTTLMALGAVLLAACSSSSDAGDGPDLPANTIRVENNAFSPGALTVAAGTTITFTWPEGSVNHNVVPWSGNPSAVPASPNQPTLLDGPTSFQATFPTAGSYKFFCTAHGSVSSTGQPTGMAGTITVQ